MINIDSVRIKESRRELVYPAFIKMPAEATVHFNVNIIFT